MPAAAPLTRLVAGLASALCLAPLVYHLVRAAERARSPEPDPAGVLWAARSHLLDRVGVTAYVTAAVALLLAPALARRAALADRVTVGCALAGSLAALVGPLAAP